jgi:DNA-binding PadR family transcriptional regulator
MCIDMVKYTKEDLEKLKNDPMMGFLADLFGLDLNKAIEEEKKSLEKEFEEAKQFNDSIHGVLDDMVKEGILTCEETVEDGVTKRVYRPVDKKEKMVDKKEEVAVDNKQEEKKEYVKPEAKPQPFLMSASQLDRFVKAYRELIENEKKLSYLYGIEFNDGESGFGFPSKINEIIWNFVRIIFGDENAEDIADYIFGNSNFDSVEALYDELV